MANDIVMQMVIEHTEPMVTGTSANGTWTRQTYVGKTLGYAPKVIRFEVWGGDRIVRLNIEKGKVYNIYLDIFSSTYKGRDEQEHWTNNIRCYDARLVENNQ